MIATSICQKALAVILMMLVIHALMGCEKDNMSDTTIAGVIPGAMGTSVGYLRLAMDNMPDITVTLIRLSDSTIRVVPGTDFMQPFVCELSLDNGILQNVNDTSSDFLSVNTLRSPYELEILQGTNKTFYLINDLVTPSCYRPKSSWVFADIFFFRMPFWQTTQTSGGF